MKPVFLFGLLLQAVLAVGQAKTDSTLKRQLDSIMTLDQRYRGILMRLMRPTDSLTRDSIAKTLSIPNNNLMGRVSDLQRAIDSSNLAFIETIFRKYGYPGKSLVGTPTNEAAWLIIQHSGKIGEYIGLIQKAGEKNELPFRLVAMMEDRYLMYQHKEQRYGSQLSRQELKNGQKEFIVWPVSDPEHVNERRKKAGFDQTVEENAKMLGVTYRVVKLSDLK